MENETIQNQSGVSGLQITNESIYLLSNSAKWAKFLAIVNFVFIGLLVIIAIFAGSVISSMGGMYGAPVGGGLITITYLIIALIAFFPTYFLLMFATNLQKAIAGNDTPTLTESFKFMNKYYLFVGVMTIIALALIALAIVFGVIGAMAAGY